MSPFLDHESHIMELESDLASAMQHKFQICQCLSRLEGSDLGSCRSSDSNCPSHRVDHCCPILGERGTPYPHLSRCLQMACRSSSPPRESNHEYWAGDSSKGCPMRLIPIEDVTV